MQLGGAQRSGGTAWGALVRSYSWGGLTGAGVPEAPNRDHTGQAGSHWAVLVQECSWGDTH